MKVRVTHHGTCHHDSEAWNLALSAALSHADVFVDSRSRMPMIRLIMRGEDVWHGGVHFAGRQIK